METVLILLAFEALRQFSGNQRRTTTCCMKKLCCYDHRWYGLGGISVVRREINQRASERTRPNKFQREPANPTRGWRAIKDQRMDDPKYPEHIERMLDVMLSLPRRSAWGLVLASVESKIGSAALQRIILQVCEIEKRIAHGKIKRERKRKRQSAIDAPKVIATITPPRQSRVNQLPM